METESVVEAAMLIVYVVAAAALRAAHDAARESLEGGATTYTGSRTTTNITNDEVAEDGRVSIDQAREVGHRVRLDTEGAAHAAEGPRLHRT